MYGHVYNGNNNTNFWKAFTSVYDVHGTDKKECKLVEHIVLKYGSLTFNVPAPTFALSKPSPTLFLA